MRRVTGTAAVAVAGALCACTQAPTTSGAEGRSTSDDCFFASTLHDWRPLDDENLILFANGRRPYHVELVRPAMGLSFDVMIGVYDRDGRICSFGGDAIIVDGVIPDRITIRSIRRLTDEQLDEVYVQFGIRAPAVIETEEVDLESAEQ
jgi:Family of unknown function (DUF6491)